MNDKTKIKIIRQIIRWIKKDWITRCEQLKDRHKTCDECRACNAVEFLEDYVTVLKNGE